MKFCKRYFSSAPAFCITRMRTCRNAPPVVNNSNAAFHVNGDIYFIAETCKRLINAVIHYLVDEVMESFKARIPYVHSRSFFDSFKTFKDFYVPCFIGLSIYILYLFFHLLPFLDSF